MEPGIVWPIPWSKPMIIPNGATVAVADGEKLRLFRNAGPGHELKLTAIEAGAVKSDNHGSGGRHHSS